MSATAASSAHFPAPVRLVFWQLDSRVEHGRSRLPKSNPHSILTLSPFLFLVANIIYTPNLIRINEVNIYTYICELAALGIRVSARAANNPGR